jgi:hypothetical protein
VGRGNAAPKKNLRPTSKKPLAPPNDAAGFAQSMMLRIRTGDYSLMKVAFRRSGMGKAMGKN